MEIFFISVVQRASRSADQRGSCVLIDCIRADDQPNLTIQFENLLFELLVASDDLQSLCQVVSIPVLNCFISLFCSIFPTDTPLSQESALVSRWHILLQQT